MQNLTITKQYYAQWLDTDPDMLDTPGIQAIYSPRRNERQMGYSRPFDLYAFVTDTTTILSYGDWLQADIGAITQCFAQAENLEDAKSALAALTGRTPGHSYKYVFTTLPGDIDTHQATQLRRDAYPDFLHFHKTLYPDANQDTWLQAYFDEIAAKGYVFGMYRDGHLISATEAPDMPYLRDTVVEPGINTLPEYRRQGCARTVCGALLKHLLETGKVPLWSCSASNLGSHRLAESLGFVKLADVLALSASM